MSEFPSRQLELHVDPPQSQSRVTVFFRIFLVIPHLIILCFLSIALDLVTIIGWFAALILGRHPFFGFVKQYLRWTARLTGYTLYLTGTYPPFTLDEVSYPIGIELEPQKLNRLKVLFRIILIFPASITYTVLIYGNFVFTTVNWLVVLVKGRLPRSLHELSSATLRFHLRYSAYMLLAQDVYPGGLAGDKQSVTPSAPGSELTNSEHSGVEEILDDEVTATAEESSLEVQLPTQLSSDPNYWKLFLGNAAKNLLCIQLALGVVVMIGYGAVEMHYLRSKIIKVSSSQWNLNYRSTISKLDSDMKHAAVVENPMSPNRTEISVNCTTVAIDYAKLYTVPQYPGSAANLYLLAGVREASGFLNSCSVKPADLSKSQLATAYNDLNLASQFFTTFLKLT